MHSVHLTLAEVTAAQQQLQRYHERYRRRLQVGEGANGIATGQGANGIACWELGVENWAWQGGR